MTTTTVKDFPRSTPESLYRLAGDIAATGGRTLVIDAMMPESLFATPGLDRLSAYPSGKGHVWRCRPAFPGLDAVVATVDAVAWVGCRDTIDYAAIARFVRFSPGLHSALKAAMEAYERTGQPDFLRRAEHIAIHPAIKP